MCQLLEELVILVIKIYSITIIISTIKRRHKMGRKDNTDRKKGGFKKGGAKIGKKYEQRGGQRVRDNSQGGKKKFNNGASGGGKPARRDRPVEDTRKDYKVKGGKSGQKPIKGNKGQFSHMVGKSLFKLIP